jgi:hypothetical protein
MRRLFPLISVASLAGALLTAVGAPSALAVSDTVAVGPGVSVTFHPFTIPGDTGCVRWTDGSYNCDPVDLIFPGRSPTQVRDLMRGKGWTTFDVGSTQYLHFADATRYAQSVQVFRPDGRNGAGQTVRYHMRLWLVRGATSTVTVGAVHHEARVSLFSDAIDRSWEDSEAFVAGQLCAGVACSVTPVLSTQSAMQGSAVWRGWATNAQATVIPR